MLEIKVKVTFDDEIKELLEAVLRLAKVDVSEVTEIEKIGDNEGESVACNSDIEVVEEEKNCDITVDMLRDMASKIIKKDRRNELKEMLSSYGVRSVLNLEKDDYAKAYDKLKGMLE